MALSVQERNKIRTELRNRCCSRFPHDPEYKEPTGEEIKLVLAISGWTYAEAAKILGVSSGKEGRSTTVQKWVSEQRKIPHSAWRLLLAYSRVREIKASDVHDILEGRVPEDKEQ